MPWQTTLLTMEPLPAQLCIVEAHYEVTKPLKIWLLSINGCSGVRDFSSLLITQLSLRVLFPSSMCFSRSITHWVNL